MSPSGAKWLNRADPLRSVTANTIQSESQDNYSYLSRVHRILPDTSGPMPCPSRRTCDCHVPSSSPLASISALKMEAKRRLNFNRVQGAVQNLKSAVGVGTGYATGGRGDAVGVKTVHFARRADLLWGRYRCLFPGRGGGR
jgi:hypothetical protein